MAALEASLLDAPPALDRLAQLRARQRARCGSTAPCATSTCTSASCTRRTTCRSRPAASARRRTKEVAYEEIGNEYDLDGEQVVLTDEELSAADPKKTRTIEIEAFVELEEIDPIYYDHPYYLVPAGETDGTVRAYRLLAEVMAKTDRVALGRFVMRTKEYLVAIRAREQALTLSTMRFHDEVRPTEGDRRRRAAARPRRRSSGAVKLIEALSVEWDPDELRGRLPQAAAGDRAQEAQGRRDQGAREPTRRRPRRCRT